ncbi:MAG: hypothetical protein JW748_01400 [Anaerolineales bacterium]|nr:hypothetical protein [Anaerolineales bacterium]
MNEKVVPAFAGGVVRNYTIGMSRQSRVRLAIAGAVLIGISCAAIVYALWPLSSIREQLVIWSNMFRMP